MKIGVITFWYTQENYGQMLQLYALQVFLKELGHDPYLIRFDNRSDVKEYIVKNSLASNIKKAIKNPLKIVDHFRSVLLLRKKFQIQLRGFDDFRNKYIRMSPKIYYSLDELKNDPPTADAYICGSDVIWNESICNMSYFLNFGDKKTKRIAYAPSFGSSFVSDNYCKLISPLLQNFDFIGVREKSGVDICNRAKFNHAEWVSDPTMIIKKDYYDNMAIKYHNSKSYIFQYFLGVEKINQLNAIYDYAASNDMDVKYVAVQGRRDHYEKLNASIEEWIGYLKGAEYVITNSFHCCVMALIYNKKFLYIPLSGFSGSLNERINSLLIEFNLENRSCKKSISEIEQDINWDRINSILLNKQKCTIEIMNNVLKQ